MRSHGELLLIAALAALPHAAAAEVVAKDPWARATVPAQRASGAFLSLKSDVPAALVSAASDAAATVELHEMKLENDVMRMRPVSRIELPAGQEVVLKPGGYHVMLMGLKRQLTKGQKLPLTLRIEYKDGKAEELRVEAEIRDLTAGAGHGHGK